MMPLDTYPCTACKKNRTGHRSGKCEECRQNMWPANTRWATQTTQTRNKRSNHRLTHQGETMTISAWEERLGFKRGLIFGRLARGWSVDDTLTVPQKSRRDKRRRTPRVTNRMLTWNGKTMAIVDWADELGVSDTTIIGRLKRGWSIKEALSTPKLRHWCERGK